MLVDSTYKKKNQSLEKWSQKDSLEAIKRLQMMEI